MSSLVFTIAQNGYGRAYARCVDSQRAYAARVGATFVNVNRPRRLPEVAISAWLKVPLSLAALQAGYDHVAYIDADCEVRATTPHFAECFADASADVLMARGWSKRINSGVIFSRKSPRAEAFFERLISSITEEIPAVDRQNLKFENGNVIYIERTEGGVGELRDVWNNTHSPDLDDYIRHYTGALRAEYSRSAVDEFVHRLGKRTIYRQLAQPASRDEAFRARLENTVKSVVTHFPEFVAAR